MTLLSIWLSRAETVIDYNVARGHDAWKTLRASQERGFTAENLKLSVALDANNDKTRKVFVPQNP